MLQQVQRQTLPCEDGPGRAVDGRDDGGLGERCAVFEMLGEPKRWFKQGKDARGDVDAGEDARILGVDDGMSRGCFGHGRQRRDVAAADVFLQPGGKHLVKILYVHGKKSFLRNQAKAGVSISLAAVFPVLVQASLVTVSWSEKCWRRASFLAG